MPGDWGLDEVEISRADKVAGHVEIMGWLNKGEYFDRRQSSESIIG